MNDVAHWRQLEELFARLRPLTRHRRARALDAACVDRPHVREELERLLAADRDSQALAIERFADDREAAATGPGARLGAWRTVEVIGAGGMGVVWLGERADGAYEQRVAIKIARPGMSDLSPSFEDEHRLLARLAHPGIARLLDAGRTAADEPYLVMDLVDGEPITAWCDQQRLDVRRRLALFVAVCEAVQHAHQALVVHGDLKPSNILVTRDGHPRLLDFGIARLLRPGADGSPGSARPVGATPSHAAPEQMRGEPITTAADMFALGVLLRELLTGIRPDDERAPLAGDHWQDAAAARSTRPRALFRMLRGDLEAIVLRATQATPERRYATVDALSRDLQRHLGGFPVEARPRSRRGRLAAFVGRHRLAVASGGVVLLLLATLATLGVAHVRALTAERERVRLERDRATSVVQLLVNLFESANPEVVPGGDRQTVGEFLARAETRMTGALADQPGVQAQLHHALGRVHAARSDNARARALLTSAVRLHRESAGPDALDTIAAQLDLAELLAWMHERDDARALAEDADARLQRHHGQDHALRATALQIRASVTADSSSARTLLAQAVAIARRRLAPEDPRRIRLASADGAALLRAGRLDEAAARFDEALTAAHGNHDGRTPAVIGLLNDRAALDIARGDARAAEARHRRGLALAIELVGPESFQVANALNNLAVAIALQGRHAEAAAALRDSHARHVRLFGTEHPRTINAARNVGMALFLDDRPAECVTWMRQASEARRRLSGPTDTGAAYMQAQLGRCLARQGALAEAVTRLERARLVLDAAGAEAADYAANVRLWLGMALWSQGERTSGGALVRTAVAHQRATRPATHPTRVEAECELTHVLDADAADGARAAIASCVAALRHAPAMPAWRAAAARALAGRYNQTS